jgi:hypothetical protein
MSSLSVKKVTTLPAALMVDSQKQTDSTFWQSLLNFRSEYLHLESASKLAD